MYILYQKVVRFTSAISCSGCNWNLQRKEGVKKNSLDVEISSNPLFIKTFGSGMKKRKPAIFLPFNTVTKLEQI